jgi:hypothetical protein
MGFGSVLIFGLIFGFIPAYIAKTKGRDFLVWYVYSVFLFVIAIIHVIIIEPYHVVQAVPGQLRKCPYCTETVQFEATVCNHCGRELTIVTTQQMKEQQEHVKKQLKKKRKTPKSIGSIVQILVIVFVLIPIIIYLLFLISSTPNYAGHRNNNPTLKNKLSTNIIKNKTTKSPKNTMYITKESALKAISEKYKLKESELNLIIDKKTGYFDIGWANPRGRAEINYFVNPKSGDVYDGVMNKIYNIINKEDFNHN